MPARRALRPLAVVVGVALAAMAPSLVAANRVHALTFGLILSAIALSLSLLGGWTKQISLAHAGFVGLGAWLTGTLTEHDWSIPACFVAVVLFSVPVGVLIALPALRLRGMFLAITTIAVMMMMQTVVFPHLIDPGRIVPLSALRPRDGLLDISDPDAFYRFTLVVVGVLFVAAALVRRSELFLRFRAASDEPLAFRSLGRSERTYKLVAFVLSVTTAMIAGLLFALLNQQVSGEVFTIEQSIAYFSFAVVGGLGSLIGPIIAGLAFGVVPSLLTDVVAIDRYLYLISGIGLVGLLIQAPGGMASIPTTMREHLGHRRPPAPEPVVDADLGSSGADPGSSRAPDGAWAALRQVVHPVAVERPSSAPMVELDRVSVRFGGLHALDDVSLAAMPEEILAVLGPNGAGKTTLFNVLSGYQRPTTGAVRLLGHDVTTRSVTARARMGLARTFQTPKTFGRLTAIENVLVAPLGDDNLGRALRAPRRSELRAAADLLDLVGLGSAADVPAERLPHVPARLLEVARALAMGPRVLLLDEPAAGMRPNESHTFATLLRRVRDELGVTVVVIDHDLDWVMDLCDRAQILNFGQTIATGAPADIRANADVVEAYLGASMQHA